MVEKDCYGILDEVFPVGPEGLREIVPACFECPERTPCLRKALSTREGVEMRAEIIDRAAARGLIGRLQRWSRKKTLSRQMKAREEKT
jgi:hypothetical protein